MVKRNAYGLKRIEDLDLGNVIRIQMKRLLSENVKGLTMDYASEHLHQW